MVSCITIAYSHFKPVIATCMAAVEESLKHLEGIVGMTGRIHAAMIGIKSDVDYFQEVGGRSPQFTTWDRILRMIAEKVSRLRTIANTVNQECCDNPNKTHYLQAVVNCVNAVGDLSLVFVSLASVVDPDMDVNSFREDADHMIQFADISCKIKSHKVYEAECDYRDLEESGADPETIRAAEEKYDRLWTAEIERDEAPRRQRQERLDAVKAWIQEACTATWVSLGD